MCVCVRKLGRQVYWEEIQRRWVKKRIFETGHQKDVIMHTQHEYISHGSERAVEHLSQNF